MSENPRARRLPKSFTLSIGQSARTSHTRNMFDDRIALFRMLERRLGADNAAFLRWLLFLPVGLAVGIVAFGAFILVAKGSGDSDVAAIGGLAAGFIGGFCSVLVGLATAPRFSRVVAVIMAVACIALASVLFCWAQASHKQEFVLSAGIAGGIYSFSAVVAAVSFIRIQAKEKLS